jgi:para-aminobenzoate synthetase component 1
MHKYEIKYYENSSVYGEMLHKNDWFVFLDSCFDISNSGRYDIISCDPYIKITSYGKNVTVENENLVSSFYDNPIDIIKKYYFRNQSNNNIPFNNGIIGYFGYDSLQNTDNTNDSFPDIAVGFYDWAIIVDHADKKSWLTCQKLNPFINALLEKINKHNLTISYDLNYSFSNFVQKTTKCEYINDIKRIKSYISNGDCYQVNYSQNFESNYSGNPWDIYKNIRKINPAPYSAFLKINDRYVISSSPERFISIVENKVETKPIKGTLKRLDDPALDKKQIDILRNDEKNLSENLMIVDLLRNDISKCCELFSVKVNKLFDIESFTSVHHIVSTISGKLKKNISSIDMLIACFPGGSITGAPKKRSMEIINELEKRKRQVYCGSIGYFDENNNMDTNICIRTIMLHRNKLYFAAGGGIIHDSDPLDEYYESLEKVSIFLKFFSNGIYKW